MDSAIFGGDEGAVVGESDESVVLNGGVEGLWEEIGDGLGKNFLGIGEEF